MDDEARLLALVWEGMSDFVSTSDKQEASTALVNAFMESGYEITDLFDAMGECSYLDKALTTKHDEVIAEDEELEEELDDEEGY